LRHKITALLACAFAFTTLATAATLRADPGTEPEPPATGDTSSRPLDAMLVRHIIERQRRETWRCQRVMGRPLTRELRASAVEPEQRIEAWRQLAVKTRRRAQHPPHKGAWLCIHRYEAAWRDPDAPYYGGLQMDLGFQRAYGGPLLRRKGTADHWTPLEQMWTAERAHGSGRGFYPWPNTARYCGLI
jgi:hypothetical protein